MKKWLLFTMLAAALTAAAQQPDRRQRSAAERQLRQQRFMERLDSMVASGDFQFHVSITQLHIFYHLYISMSIDFFNLIQRADAASNQCWPRKYWNFLDRRGTPYS